MVDIPIGTRVELPKASDILNLSDEFLIEIITLGILSTNGSEIKIIPSGADYTSQPTYAGGSITIDMLLNEKVTSYFTDRGYVVSVQQPASSNGYGVTLITAHQ